VDKWRYCHWPLFSCFHDTNYSPFLHQVFLEQPHLPHLEPHCSAQPNNLQNPSREISNYPTMNDESLCDDFNREARTQASVDVCKILTFIPICYPLMTSKLSGFIQCSRKSWHLTVKRSVYENSSIWRVVHQHGMNSESTWLGQKNVRYNTNTWQGTALTLVDKLMATICLYNDVAPTQLSDEMAILIVKNAVAPCPELAAVEARNQYE